MIRRVLALALLMSFLVAPAVVPAQAVAPTRKVVYFDLFENQKVAPKRIYFSANSGTYVRKLAWKDWGAARTVAHGQYVSTCASCDPPRYRKATITFSRLAFCATRNVWYYQRGVLVRPPSEGQTRRVEIGGGVCPSE